MRRAIWVISTLALCACERADRTKTVELPVPKVTVHVLDPGAAPRAPLRYHGNGHRPTVYKMTSRITTDGGLTKETTRSFESTCELLADGIYHSFERAIDGDVATMDQWYDAREVHARPTVAHGRNTGENSATAALQGIFPEEPVGVGARWHEDITVGSSTASVDVELVARDGDHARERLTYHAEGKSPKNGWPMHHDGTATLELDLGGADPSVHHEDTFVMDESNGRVAKGTMTVDIVRQ